MVIGLAALVLAGCGGGSTGDDAVVEQLPEGTFKGGQVLPLTPAPAIGMKDLDGDVVDPAALSGKVVLVTFVYARCPDICNLIVDSMKAAKTSLGAKGKQVELVAVSVDPERDTPAVVRDFLKRHNLSGQIRYVIGARAQLEPIWEAWAVAARENFDNPALVEHSGVVWMLDKQGNRAVYFPVSAVNGPDMAHDIRVLLDQ